MMQKIEHAKNLIIKDYLTLTEVAYRLNYSSVAHLSTQFKNITGITPSQFQRIITKRREIFGPNFCFIERIIDRNDSLHIYDYDLEEAMNVKPMQTFHGVQ